MLIEQPRTQEQKRKALEIEVFALRDKVHSMELELKLIADRLMDMATETTKHKG